MRPIDEKNLLADIEGLKKSPWFNADYISDERRLGMKEALDMMSSIIRNSQTIDAIPVTRCRDCKHYLKSDEECQLISTRLHFYEVNKKWEKESFCSWAERREK